MPASLIAIRQGSIVFSIRSSTRLSNLARVTLIARCLGPDWSAVMYGRLISVCCAGGELDLGLFRGVLQPLQREHVLAQVDAAFLLELVAQVLDQALVEILAAEEGVAIGGEHLELTSRPSTSAISMIEMSNVPPPRS